MVKCYCGRSWRSDNTYYDEAKESIIKFGHCRTCERKAKGMKIVQKKEQRLKVKMITIYQARRLMDLCLLESVKSPAERHAIINRYLIKEKI